MRLVIRVRQRSTRASRFVTGSLVVHAAVAAGFLALPGFADRSAVIAEDALIVELAGGLPAPPSTGASVPPPLQIDPLPDGPTVVPEVPPPAKEPPKPEVKKEKKPDPPEPTPQVAPKAAPAEGREAGPDNDLSGRSDAVGTGITASGSSDPTLAGYYARISALLNAHWARPVLLEDGGEPRSVVVSFEIARNGNVFNLRIDTASGLDILDRSALRAVLDASPLPPAPGGWSGGSVPVRVRFVLDPGIP
jgi:protein TonB